jgi:CheY-like chemotaxis protein
MAKSILWIDNDLPYIRPYRQALEKKGYFVEAVSSLGDAERLAEEKSFDLIIIDVMVPTQNEEEAANYPYVSSDYGHKTGLLFYRRMKEKLGKHLPVIVALTVRLDQDIRDEFVQSGLNKENFFTKYSVREVPQFLNKIESILSKSKNPNTLN